MDISKFLKKLSNFRIKLHLILACSFLILPVFATSVRATDITLENPHKNYSFNYKGNIHAHSTNSDGSDAPAVVGQWYHDHSYDFYAITDHNYLTPDPGTADILWLGKSEEASITGNSAHMNVFNINTAIPSGAVQTMIDNAIGQGGKVSLNHIDRSDKLWSAETIKNLTDVMSLEIYNGSGLNSTGTWDEVLTSGKNVWGTAGDDSHSASGRGRAYIVVNSDNPAPMANDILSEMAAGNFYASKGFDLSISVTGSTITASTSNGNKIKWIKHSGREIKTTEATSDNYTATGYEYYVRIEILDASGTPKAWSQPIYLAGASPPSTHSPMYRLYNTSNGAYLYTRSEADKNRVMSLWPEFEFTDGIPAFYTSHAIQSGLTPIYRLYNTQNGAYLYTRGDSDRDRILSLYPEFEYTDTIPAFYASLDEQPGLTPIYRLYNTKNGMYLYTRGDADKEHVMSTWPEFEFTDGFPAFYASLN